MTSGQRVALSLLISVVLFAAFTVAAFSGLFSLVETKFHQPRVVGEIEGRLGRISDAEERYFEGLFKRFGAFVSDESVRTFAQSRPDDSSVRIRESLRASLMSGTRSLVGIRIIDGSGINILYSSFSSDVMSSAAGKTTYRKYSDLVSSREGELSYADIRMNDVRTGNFGTIRKNRIFFDSERNRMILSLPFYDSDERYAGTAVFYCDPGDLSRFLFEENLIDITGYAFMVSDSDGFGGFVFGLSNVGRTSLSKLILEQWSLDGRGVGNYEGGVSVRNIVPVLSGESEKMFGYTDVDAGSAGGKNPGEVKILFSRKSDVDGIGFCAWIYDRDIMLFPKGVRVLLLSLVFATVFLAVFLISSFRGDDMAVIRKRIKQFQLAFVTESIGNFDGSGKLLDLSGNKERVNEEIRRSLGRRAVRHSAEVDALLEKSWSEIFSLMGVPSDGKISASFDTDELRRILEDVLGSTAIKVSAVPAQSAPIDAPALSPDFASPEPANEVEKVEETEPVAEAEETESVEEIEEIEPAEEIAEVEEAESVEEVEPIDEVEEAESVEEVESVEEIEENAETESVEEIEEAEPVDEVEEIEETSVDEADEVESVEEVEEAESVEEVEPIDEVEEAESVEEVESVEEIEENAETESAEEIEEAESVEEAEEAESVEEVESVEEIEENAETESAEEIEEVGPVDEVEKVEPAEEIEEAEADSVRGAFDSVDLEEFGAAGYGGKDASESENALGTAHDFSEPKTFSSPLPLDSIFDTSIGDAIALEFTATRPDLSFLDEPEEAEPAVEESAKAEAGAEAPEEVESLGAKERGGSFLFSRFSAGDSPSEVVSE